jgi:hypothetical protein
MNRANNDRTIVFFSMALSQPRCIKRVTSLRDYGFSCIVYGYDRGKYDINDYPLNVKVYHLGILKDNEYVGKAIKVYRDIAKVRKRYSKEKPLYYAFGIFPALYLRLLGERYIYEISDILYAYPKFKLFLGILRALDKRIIRGSLATVMTSGGFYSFFNIDLPKVFIIPNRVSPLLQRPIFQITQMETGKLSFGFVGSLRYKTILDFADVIGESFPQYDFHFWGGLQDGPMKDAVDNLVGRYTNICYHGAFRSPADLPIVYESFDITVSCYQVSSLNERLAEPNKLYESLFFNKPIIVSEGIYLSDRVNEMDCGFCVNASSKELIYYFIKTLKVGEVKRLSEHISHFDEGLIVNNQKGLNEFILSSYKKAK